MSCTSSDLDKNTCKFQKGPAKAVGGVAFTRFCDGCKGKYNASFGPDGGRHNAYKYKMFD